MTIEQANAYFASLPEGFAPARQLQEALSAKAGRVDYLGVAGTAGKTTAAALTAAVLRAAGLVTGSYHAGCEPLSARIRVNGEPVAPELLAQAAETLSARETLPRAAAELAAYYSKGRSDSKVDVDCTLVRNVKKPAHAAPGFVIFEGQTTYHVAPKKWE